MSDIVERLRAIPVWMAGAMTPGWQEHGTSAYEAADVIESLRAENARLTEERDALAEAMGIIVSLTHRGQSLVSRQVNKIAFAALAKIKRGPDAR
ncbi:hypothetical protein [Sphingopyxis sp. 550A]